ncbi:MAG: TetR/AcrR family transcriptional regulator [Thermoanaerobaculia bacterium]
MVKADGQNRDKATELRILDAAHAVVVRSGTSGARMQQIAEEAGVNKALVHYYFRSKDQLARAVFSRAAAELFPAVMEVLASDAPLDDKVRRVVDIELSQLLKRPYLPGYILSEINHEPERVLQFFEAAVGLRPDKVGPRLIATIRSQIKTEVEAGRMVSIAAEDFIVNLLSLCIFPFAARPMFMALIGLDEKQFARFIERRRNDLPEFFMRGVRP